MRPAAQVERDDGQRLVHRHDEVAGAVDAAAIAQRLRHRFAERDAEVLDRVMLIDVEIAGGLDVEVEGAVPREQLQHVIEKPDAGRDGIAAASLDRQLQLDLRLVRLAIDHCAPHRYSSMAATAASVASTVPVVTRMQPRQFGSADLSRM